ncbi:MAG TPA: PEGA domain-containing protein [Kofleriaceae bacterium]
MQEKYKLAVQLDDSGDAEKALVLINEGLAIAPKDLPLLGLKGAVLLKLRDYTAALAAYQAYLDAGATGANRREAQKIVNNLDAVKSTFLAVTLANGPAAIYLDSKTQGVFCTAAPSCNQAVLPGQYKVLAERSGFERWTGRVTIENGKTATLAITLVEKPSLLTVRVAQPGARITVDDTAYDAPTTVPAGSHRVVVSLTGHVEARLEAVAHEGKPVELDVALAPLVAIRVEPPGAALWLDDKPVAMEKGSLAIPPGAHTLVARAHGFEDHRIEIPAVRAPDYKLEVGLARVLPPPSRFTDRRKIALGVGGVGLAALAGGVVLGLQSRQLDHDTYALCPSTSAPCPDARNADDLNRRARSRALQANIVYGVAGGAAIAAAVLWLTGAPESRVAVTPQLGAVAGLDVAVRF